MDYIICENGNFPAQYLVMKKGDDGIYHIVFGPDPDIEDAERKLAELTGSNERAKNDKGQFIADDPKTSNVNEAYVSGKKPVKKKEKKIVIKKKVTKKVSKKK